MLNTLYGGYTDMDLIDILTGKADSTCTGKYFEGKLGENGVNIRMITQGPEELNIIVGVEEKDFAQAIRVLYDSFVKEHI